MGKLRFFRTRPGLILAVAAAVEVGLCVGYHRERWHKALVPRGLAQARAGEGLIIRSDGLGYYAWLRSLLIDGDWQFDNEFDSHNPLGDYVPPAERRTAAGRRRNQWSVGPALAWALVVVPGHAARLAWGDGSVWPADGYSLPYQVMVGGTTLLGSLVGLGFLYRLCRGHADPEAAAWAAAFLTLGTTIVYYAAVEVSMAHGLGTAAVAGLVYYWQKTYGSDGFGRWLAVGVLVGVAALMRWQLVTFALLPAGEGVLGVVRQRRAVGQSLILVTLAAVGAWAAFTPQMIAWRVVYGEWLARPLATAHHWGSPAVGRLLIAEDRGLFYWTPAAGVGLAGTVAFLTRWWFRGPQGSSACLWHAAKPGRHRTEIVALLLAAFALQVYVLASLWGAEVSLAVGFGCRQLTESLVALAPGLAMLLGAAPGRWRRLACGVGCLLVLWNLLLICQYRYGYVPAAAGADAATLLASAVRLVGRKKVAVAAQAVLGPLLLGALLWRGGSNREAVDTGIRRGIL